MAVRRITEQGESQVYGAKADANEKSLYASPRFERSILIDLGGHEIINLTNNDREPTNDRSASLRRGRWVEILRESPAEIQNMTASLRKPHGAWSPARAIAKNGAECFDYVIVPLCRNACEQRFEVYEGNTGEGRKLEKLVGFGSTNGAPIDEEYPLKFHAFREQWLLNNVALGEGDSGADPLYAIAALDSQNCAADCDEITVGKTFYATGGNGTDSSTTVKTEDGFATAPAAVSSGLAATEIGTALLVDSSLILQGYADTGVFTTGASGGIRYSTDGTNWNDGVDSGGSAIATPVYDIIKAGRYYYAAGGAVLLRSADGATWETVTVSALTAPAYSSLAYDAKTGIVYAAGDDTGGFLIMLNDGIITDLSSDVGAPGSLSAVHVLGDNHVAVGGANGFFAEAHNVSGGGATWHGKNYGSAGTDFVYSIQGDSLYMMFSMNSDIYQRNPVTEQEIQQITFSGVTWSGNVTALAFVMEDDGNISRARAVTDAGEVINFEDCLPDYDSLVTR